jgi:ferrochelatase
MRSDNPTYGILLVNLGSPAAPTATAISEWLVEFLSDPGVIELPRWLWRPLLKTIIAPKRAPKLAKLYSTIWTDQGSPLVVITQRQAAALNSLLNQRGYKVKVASAMRYGLPNLAEALQKLQTECDSLHVLMLYPQYAKSTSGSALRLINETAGTRPTIIDAYATAPAYIAALAEHINRYWQTHGRGEHLLISYHGLPQSAVRRGDPYQQQCEQTTTALVSALNLTETDYTLCYQSRFGAARWIGPATVDIATARAADGAERIDVVCPGFPADCLETLEEISVQVRDKFVTAGGKTLQYIPALNDSPHWITAMADLLEPGLRI